MYCSFISVLALAVAVNGASHSIDVGEDGSFAFNPNSLTAAVGDTLEFHFYSGSGGHSVVSSTFDSPCVPAPNAFFSGYQKANDKGDTTFVVNVTSTDPIWFYCSLQSHCQNGMVGVVNPPAGQTVDDYSAAAAKVARASAPASVAGGVLTTIEPEGDSSSTASVGGASEGSSTTAATTTTAGTSAPASTRASTTTSPSAASSPSGSTTPTASTTPSDAGRRDVSWIVLGLTAVVGGLVALMA